MNCPTCGRHTGVYDSRQSGVHVRRRRQCPAGHRFTTYEAPVDEEFGDPARALGSLVRLIRKARAASLRGTWLDDREDELLERLLRGGATMPPAP